MNPAKHNPNSCPYKDTIIEMEKDLVEVQTTTKYMYEDLTELKTAIKECTHALNELSNKISVEETHTDTTKWFVMFIVAIAGIIIGYIL